MMGAVRRGDDFGRPMRRLVAAKLRRQFDLRGANVFPRGAAVGGFGDSEPRAVDPCHAVEPGRGGSAIGVEHPPAFDVRVPEGRRIRRAIEHRIAKERLGSDRAEVNGIRRRRVRHAASPRAGFSRCNETNAAKQEHEKEKTKTGNFMPRV